MVTLSNSIRDKADRVLWSTIRTVALNNPNTVGERNLIGNLVGAEVLPHLGGDQSSSIPHANKPRGQGHGLCTICDLTYSIRDVAGYQFCRLPVQAGIRYFSLLS